MPVGWCDNEAVILSLSDMVHSRSDAVWLVERLGATVNLNVMGCLLFVIVRHCTNTGKCDLALMLHFFDRCRFKEHNLFLNTFLPYVVDLVKECGPVGEDATLLRVCESALMAVEGLSANGLRYDYYVSLVETLLNQLGGRPEGTKVSEQLTRVKQVIEIRWGWVVGEKRLE